jgi:hypothetical protein
MRNGWLALLSIGLLAGAFSSGDVSAADLKDNCCADLEERIAELEVTSVHKGNRKVQLTISGWVAEQLTWWDDGYESNLYISGLGTTLASHFKLTGQATIAAGWSAGFVLHIEADGSDALLGTDQNTDNGPGFFTSPAPFADPKGGHAGFVQTLNAFWFVKSEQLGKVSVGTQSMASDNAALLVDGSGTLVMANWCGYNTEGFFMRQSDGTLHDGVDAPFFIWAQAGSCNNGGDCYGAPLQSVRYDSPDFAGFSVSTSWGADDIWDVAARYAGELSGFKIAAAASYGERDGVILGAPLDDQYFQAGLYVQHDSTGLWGMVNYGKLMVTGVEPESDTWFLKAGIRERWNGLGHTVLYGEYNINDDGAATVFANTLGPTGSAITTSKSEWWGGGIVQEIDAAAMMVWLRWRTFAYEDNTVFQYENLDEITVGTLINF